MKPKRKMIILRKVINFVEGFFEEPNYEATTVRFILEGGLDIFTWGLIAMINVKREATFGPKF